MRKNRDLIIIRWREDDKDQLLITSEKNIRNEIEFRWGQNYDIEALRHELSIGVTTLFAAVRLYPSKLLHLTEDPDKELAEKIESFDDADKSEGMM